MLIFPLFAAHFSCFFFSVLCFQRQSPGFAGCCPCSSGACASARTSRTSRTGTTPTVGQHLADLATGGSWWIHVASPDLHTRSVTRVTTCSESFTECYHMLPCFIMFLVQKCVSDFVITSHLRFSHWTWERPCKCRILVSAPGPGATASSGATTKSRTRSYEKVQHMQHTATVRFHMFILVILFPIISDHFWILEHSQESKIHQELVEAFSRTLVTVWFHNSSC